MATPVPTSPSSSDIPHTPISNEGAVGGSEELQQFQQQPLRQNRNQSPVRQSAQTKRMSSTSVDTAGQKRRSRASIGALQGSVVSVVKIESPSSRRQSTSHHSNKKSHSKSRSRSPRSRRASGNDQQRGFEIEMDLGHVQGMMFELDGRRVSVSSNAGIVGGMGGGSPSVGGAVTPIDRLPPSPPLTRVGSHDSIRLSRRRSRRTSKGRSLDAKSGGGGANETGAEILPNGDISLQNMRTYRPEEGVLDHGDAHTQTQAVGVARELAHSVEDGSFVPPGIGQFDPSTSTRPSSPPTALSQNWPTGDTQVLQHPMYSSYSVMGATTSTAHRPVPLRSRASEAKLTGQLSPLPSPTRDHPLYRPPSPQPWDLVSPPLQNNAGVVGNAVGNEPTYADGTGRSRQTAASGTLDGREGSVESEILNEKEIVVKNGKRYRIPHSSYYFGPPPDTSAFGTEPIGQIGVHHPREIVRVERDYSGGELCQFSPAYPLELEGRITPTQFIEMINIVNESMISAHSLRWSCLDNALAVFTLYLSRLLVRSHYERELNRLKSRIDELNKTVYNPAGLNILWPKSVAFMFLEIEYY